MSGTLYHKSNYNKLSRLKQLGVLLCLVPSLAQTQEEIIVFHNVENLFYPLDDSLTLDDDYTVGGKKHWTFGKYKTKLNALAKTYISIDANQMPALIGLCEIENNQVLNALTKDTPLRKTGYRYIHYPSKDIRGIDVALLYDPKKFKIKESFPMSPVSTKEEDRTRDVLYVKGVLGQIEVNLYVVHAPSRRENNIKKELRQKIFANIYSDIEKRIKNGEENFIVMGDMNDNPWDESILKGFNQEYINENNPQILFNLMSNNKDKTGSYVFNGNIFSFDQFLVSDKIKQRLVFNNTFNETFVYKPDFLVSKDRRKNYDRPFSTYKGMKYEGGISDHFPIIMRLTIKRK
ncbi:MAG: hypothetical protein IJ681_01880 [Bacteroidales bacterium]|nr:hypothetical protein [Bacteroidales bacterium]